MSFLGAQNSIALGVQGLIHIDTGVVGSADYLLAKSLRFRSSASAYLNRTLTTPTSSTIYTWSGWVKRGTLSATGYLFGASTTTNFGFNSSNQLLLTLSGTAAVTTTAVYRDPAAWYHLVYVQNGATQTIYVNGVSAGTGTTANTVFNTAIAHQLAAANTTSYFDGEMAEVNFVDGQALAPTAFGAYSTYNQWLPIAYAGTYGTNGFYLPFSATSATSYAGLFNGSTQYLNVNSVTAVGTGDFTVEAFVYFNAVGSDQAFFQLDTAGLITNWSLSLDAATNTFRFLVRNDANITNADIYSSTVAVAKQWYHVAGVVSGTTATLYVNGISVASATLSGVRTGTGTTIYMGQNGPSGGRFLNGYMSNNRYVKGTAVYTANFIPPTANLTNITNTVLLTLQNATIVDNSSNGYAIVNNNTVVTSVQSPFLNPTVLVADSSGNANNWTPNNISLTAGSTYDSLTDVPTLTSTTVANYAVLNPLDHTVNSYATLANGNLQALGNTATDSGAFAGTIAANSGLYYWESTRVGTAGLAYAGATQPGITAVNADTLNAIYRSDGSTRFFGVAGTSLSNWNTAGDVIMVALDMTNGAIYYGKNGTWLNSGVPTSGASKTGALNTWTAGTYTFAPIGGGYTSGNGVNVNFGQQPFTYTAPSGFLPLNTFNITAGTVTTSGTFTGNLSTDGPFVFLNGTPTAMTINGNAVTFGTQADKLANGFKVRSSSASYNTAGSNTYVATTVGAVFKYEDAQSNP